MTNGDLSNGTTGFSSARGNSTLSVVGGKLRVTASASGAFGASNLVTGIGAAKVLILSLDGINTSGDVSVLSLRVDTVDSSLPTGSQVVQDILGDASATTAPFIAATSRYVGVVGVAGAAGDYFEIDNISIREINPLAVSIGYKALVTYADDGSAPRLLQYGVSGGEELRLNLVTGGDQTGTIQAVARVSGVIDLAPAGAYTPGINVPMSISARLGSNFLQVAKDGVSGSENTTLAGFPDLSTRDLVIAYSGGPQVIQEFIMWGGTTGDIGDAGIAETST